MATPKHTWNGLGLVAATLWLAAIAYLGIHYGFRGSHPESLHAFYCVCALSLFHGTPIFALFSTGVISNARSSGDDVPPIATRSRNAAWILTGIVALWFFGHLIISLYTPFRQGPV